MTLVELAVVVAIGAIVSGLVSGAIAKATGGDFWEGFASGLISGALITGMAAVGVPLPAAMALGSALTTAFMEWYLNGFENPTASAIRITAAFVVGLLGGGLLRKIPVFSFSDEQLAAMLTSLKLDAGVKALSGALTEMSLKGFSMGIISRAVDVVIELVESIHNAGARLFGPDRDMLLGKLNEGMHEPTS